MTTDAPPKNVYVTAACAIAAALCAGFIIFLLHEWTKESTDSELALVEIKSELRALSALEWESIAKELVSAGADSKLARGTERIDRLLAKIGKKGENKDLLELDRLYGEFKTVVKREFDLIKAGRIEEAKELDESEIDPLFDKLHDKISDLTSEMAAVRHKVEAVSDGGTLLSLLFAALFIGYLFVRFTRKQLEHTSRLSAALTELQQTQDQLVRSARLAALGQLVAGIAHEVNTPLGAIQAAAGNGRKALAQALAALPELPQRLNESDQALFFVLLHDSLSNAELVTSGERRRVVRALADQLEGAGVEDARNVSDLLVDIGVRGDIDTILPLLQHAHRDWVLRLAYDLRRLHGNNETIVSAVERATKVLFAFKNYARVQDSGDKTSVDLRENVQLVLELYRSQLRRGVDVEVDLQDIPPVKGHPDELMQVWTNLIYNAVQAMEGKGKLTLGSEHREGHVVINITDSGPGIPAEIQQEIFEPFFTTKILGEGTGLGLHICKKIVAKHDGRIKVMSEPGKTTFSVWLPESGSPAPLAS